MNPVHTGQSYFFKGPYSYYLPSMLISCKWPLSFRFPCWNHVSISLLPRKCHIFQLPHKIHQSNNSSLRKNTIVWSDVDSNNKSINTVHNFLSLFTTPVVLLCQNNRDIILKCAEQFVLSSHHTNSALLFWRCQLRAFFQSLFSFYSN